MPNIKSKEHEFTKKEGTEVDVIVKSFGFRFYFEKYYQLISLGNDLLTGILYVTASVLTLMNASSLYSNIFYFLGALFLTLRPLIKIYRNTFISKAQPIRTKSEKDIKQNLKDAEENLKQSEKDRKQAEEENEQEVSDSEDKIEVKQKETNLKGNGSKEGKSEEERDRAAKKRKLEKVERKFDEEN